MSVPGRMSGKRALITGAASGIGAACARLFAAEGAAVAIADLDDVRGPAVAEEIGESGGDAWFLKTDVTDREACRSMVRDAAKHMGGLDALVSNAITYGPRDGSAEQGWDATLRSGVDAVWVAAMEARPHLAESGRGAILTVGSVAGARFGFSTAGYSAAKAAVVGLTRWLAKEFGPQGIRANCLCPGLIETPLWHKPGEPYPPRFERWVAMTPLQRAGKAVEVAHAALFLVADEASFVTGQDIVIDGGFCTGMRFETMDADGESTP